MDKENIMQISKDFDNSLDLESSRPISHSSSFSENVKTSPAKPKEDLQAPSYEKKHNLQPYNNNKEKELEFKTDDKEVKRKKVTKAVIGFLAKNLGMVIIVILYVSGGAFLFKILEQHNEIQNCQMGEGEWTNLRISFRAKVFNYIYFNTTSNPWLPVDNSTIIPSLNTPRDGPSVYNPMLTQWIIDFRDQVHNIRSTYKYTGQDCEKQSSWSYFSSLLFTITIVTTIGYFTKMMLHYNFIF